MLGEKEAALSRLGLAIVLCMVVACATDTDTDTDIETDVDTDTDTDTDTSDSMNWIDRTIETSTTLNAVYTGGTGAWVFGDAGQAWKIAQGRVLSSPRI